MKKIKVRRSELSFFAFFCIFLVCQTIRAQEFVPGEVIIKMRDEGGGKKPSFEKTRGFLNRLSQQKGLRKKGSFDDLRLHHFKTKPNEDVIRLVGELRNDPDVEYAEPNYIIRRASTSGFFNTMTSSELQAQSATNSTFSLTSADIHLSEAWDILSPTSSVTPVVAVIDTGLDTNHEVIDGTGALWTNGDEIDGNGIDDDNNGYVDDVHGWNFVDNSPNMYDDDGHGTHVSGIILGSTLEIFSSPYAPAKIRIMPLKFLDGTGSGTTSDAVKAIYYAVKNGAKILNNSWGGPSYSNALHEAIAYSYERRTLFVAAAGNSGTNNDETPMYPANYDVPNVLAVAATKSNDSLASFSNYGFSKVHVGSPGMSILSLLPSCVPPDVTYCDYGYASGTSMAAPFVSGLAALVYYESPNMSGYEIKNIVFGSSDSISALRNKVKTESRINTFGAVEDSQSTGGTGYQPNYVLKLGEGDRELASDFSSGGGCGTLSSTIAAKQAWEKLRSGNPPRGPLGALVIALIVMAPLLLVLLLRYREQMQERKADLKSNHRRRHERFKISTAVTVKIGDREMIGSVSTISLGGLQLNTSALLEKGGRLELKVRGPEGRDEIIVLGDVVWSEAQKTYGIQFADPSRDALNAISAWTKSLIKA